MYKIHTTDFGPYTRYTVENPDTGNGFSIVPEAGATVLQIWIKGRPVLDGYETPEELQEGKWGKSAVLFPFPNRMRDGQYEWGGITYQFPLNNAATGNAIHGFARSQPFIVAKERVGADFGSVTVTMEYDGNLPYYPFPCTLELQFTCSDQGFFETRVRIHNRHKAPIPTGFGWHPYFKLSERADDVQMQLSSCAQVNIDDRMLPTGATTPFDAFNQLSTIGDTFLDNCFLAGGPVSLRLQHGDMGLTLEADASVFPYFQVFTPPHRTCVALEPMTCNVDAFNNSDGLVSLAPGALHSGTFTLYFD